MEKQLWVLVLLEKLCICPFISTNVKANSRGLKGLFVNAWLGSNCLEVAIIVEDQSLRGRNVVP